MGLSAGVRRGVQHRKFYAALVEDLIRFAEHEFRLQRKKPDGGTERDHLESARRQLAKMGGVAPAIVVPVTPPFPALLGYLWGWFFELLEGAEPGGMGPSRVTWGTLASWCGLTSTELEPWEARVLVRLGTVFAAALSSDNKTPAGKGA